MKRMVIFLALGLFLFSVPAMSQEITDDFFVTVGAGTVIEGGGSGFAGGEWYVYPSKSHDKDELNRLVDLLNEAERKRG